EFRKKGLVAALLAATAFVAACSPGYPRLLLWHKFARHDPAAEVAVSADPRCPKIGPQNLREDEKAILLAAMAEVCAITLSDEFEREVRGRTWLATCLGAKGETISGDEVYRLFMGARPFSVRFRKPMNAEATTEIANERMAIRRARLKAWRAGGAKRGALINTLAHEMTHMVPATARPEIFRFQDSDHRKRKRPALELASYGIGNLVEQLWLKRAGLPVPAPRETVESC
ncbi:MAG TPA: hypothetical protein VFR28_08335, partial [Allosphingosinicella sp.]|nr:hypothetical protein [Allosphingosinicella sp.]